MKIKNLFLTITLLSGLTFNTASKADDLWYAVTFASALTTFFGYKITSKALKKDKKLTDKIVMTVCAVGLLVLLPDILDLKSDVEFWMKYRR